MPEGIYCSIPFSLLFIDFQVNQQLSLMTFNQTLRNFLISLSNLNYTVLLYWVILMQDLIILNDTTINNTWTTSTNVKSNSFITKPLSFIELIYTDQPNIAVVCGVHLLVDPNFHR